MLGLALLSLFSRRTTAPPAHLCGRTLIQTCIPLGFSISFAIGTLLSLLLFGATSVGQPVDEPRVEPFSHDLKSRRFIDVTKDDGILLHSVPESIEVGRSESKPVSRTWLVQVKEIKTESKPEEGSCEGSDPLVCFAVIVVLAALLFIGLLRQVISERSISPGSGAVLALTLAIVTGGAVYYFGYYLDNPIQSVNICFDNASETKYDVFVDGNYLLSVEPNAHTGELFNKEFPLTPDNPEANVEIKIVDPATDTVFEWVNVKVKPAYPHRYLYNIGKRNEYERHSVAYGY